MSYTPPSEHSPTPWSLAEATTTIPIKDANGKTVASVRYGPTDLGNATAIITGVNCHHDLLDELRRRLEARFEEIAAAGHKYDSMADNDPEIIRLRALFAKAEGRRQVGLRREPGTGR